MKYTLVNVEERARKNPISFRLPSLKERTMLRSGDLVKLIVQAKNTVNERLWVQVEGLAPGEFRHYVGALSNHPVSAAFGLAYGDKITFGPEHVAAIASAEA